MSNDTTSAVDVMTGQALANRVIESQFSFLFMGGSNLFDSESVKGGLLGIDQQSDWVTRAWVNRQFKGSARCEQAISEVLVELDGGKFIDRSNEY